MHMKRTADRLLGDNYHWSVLGAGANQMRVAAMAAAMGGNVRVGMEDSLWIGPGKLAESNAQQVTRVAPDHRGPRPARSPIPTRRAKSCRSRAATRSGSSNRVTRVFKSRSAHRGRVRRTASRYNICRCVLRTRPPIGGAKGAAMASLDTVSITILFGSLLVLAGIMSSLIALRFGAPLLLVFLLVGMLAGEVRHRRPQVQRRRMAYTVGSVALGLILFDGGLRTRLATFRNVLAPAGLLATVGVLVTAALTAPVAAWALGLNWIEALLVGAVMASTDAAAVFFLLHAKGLRLRPRVSATLEVEFGDQRSVRHLPHHRAGRNPVLRRQVMGRHRGFCCRRRCSAR